MRSPHGPPRPRPSACAFLLTIADKIDANRDALAEAESADTGKPLKLAKAVDIPRAAANFRFFATAILHTHTEAYRTDGLALNYTLRQPPRQTADPQGDADRQRLRTMERTLRQWKLREQAAIDPAAKAQAGAKVREWQAAIRTHCASTTAKRQPAREQIGVAR